MVDSAVQSAEPFHARAGSAYEKHRGLSLVEVLEEVLDIARLEQVNAADDVEIRSSSVPTSRLWCRRRHGSGCIQRRSRWQGSARGGKLPASSWADVSEAIGKISKGASGTVSLASAFKARRGSLAIAAGRGSVSMRVRPCPELLVASPRWPPAIMIFALIWQHS